MIFILGRIQRDTYGEHFDSISSFNNNISSWNVSSVTSMEYIFHIESKFISNLSSWNVSNITRMYDIFRLVSLFNNYIILGRI